MGVVRGPREVDSTIHPDATGDAANRRFRWFGWIGALVGLLIGLVLLSSGVGGKKAG
jgi:hypothetical protein